MNGNFFANYSNFIVIPTEQQESGKKEYDPNDYATYYILTLALYDSLLLNWSEAHKYDVEVERCIESVLEDFNSSQIDHYHLQLLELDKQKTYFVLALSCKNKIESKDANERIAYIIEKMLTNPFYIGQSWYKFTGDRGRIERKLFCFSFKEYTS
ncbi:hypothetical protein JOC77_003975 [Peribacillus deserti]|uniref:Uncharacterized protein n=1 Tax=Peribacillus deserti TaxID=673318 RepID=A0ABS2QN12_9BACI|nr:hypothetical protein [Peribacillus deserti]MBM7694512.1 hypothetical protein [Peribacillus deserti]